MQDQVKRPPIIWITQVGLLLWSLMIIPNAALASALVWDSDFPPRQLIWGLLMGILPFVAFWALVKRAAFSRELTLLSLICTWVYLIRSFMLSFGPSSGMNTFPLSPKRLLLFALIVVPFCLLPVLFVKLGYGKKASSFFNAFTR